MKVSVITKAVIRGYTGQPDQAPTLFAIAYFSDGYHAAFDFDARNRKVTMRRKDGNGWTYNDRPSRARIEAILNAVDPVWTEAFADAARLFADKQAWDQERTAFYVRRSASESMYAACRELVRAAKEGGDISAAVELATVALQIATGRDRQEFQIVDKTHPGLTTCVRHSSMELALVDYMMGRETRPDPRNISVKDA